jgi:hypothetical protein
MMEGMLDKDATSFDGLFDSIRKLQLKSRESE